jgi:hypothetical protein
MYDQRIWSRGVVMMENGKPIEMVGAVQDITGIKRNEQKKSRNGRDFLSFAFALISPLNFARAIIINSHCFPHFRMVSKSPFVIIPVSC